MPDTNFGNPFMANMSENPVHKIVVEVRNKAVPTRADVMQSKEGTFIAVPVEYDPNKDHAYKFAGPNQKKLLKEFGENFISVTQFGSIIEGIDDTSAINKLNKILKSVGIEKTITGELKAITNEAFDSMGKEVARLSPEYGKQFENITNRIKNFRAADAYGNAFHRAIELLEKEGKTNDPKDVEKVLKRMAREKKAEKTYGNVLSDASGGDRSRTALLKDIDAYFKKKTELGLGNVIGAEQQLGAVVKVGNDIVKIAGTFDQLFLKTNYILRDLKTSSSKQPSPAYGLQLNLLEKLLNSVGISVSERGITRVRKGEAFDYKIGKISDQDIIKLISMVLDIQKEKDPSNRETLQVQARNILGGGAIQTRISKRGRQTTYNDMTLEDIQKYSYLTEDQKIDLVKNLFSGMSARDKDLFVSSLFNTNKYGKEGVAEPSNDFYRKGPFYDRLRKEIPNPYFGTASSDFGYKEFETKEGEKVGGSVYGELFASQNAQKYRILKAKYGEAVANKFLDQMLKDIDTAIGAKTDDKTSYETAKSAENFFRSLGLVEDKTPLNRDFVKRIDELSPGYRNISGFLERERFGDLGGQLQGISKEEQALMARSSSDYRGIKETDQIFKTLAFLREIGEGAGGLFDIIKKMEVDSKNIEDPKELLNKYSDILYSIFSGFSDFKDLISKSIKNLGRVSEIDEFGNYLEENKSEQILDYVNDFYSNAENIIKNSQLTPEVQQNLIERLSYARSTEKNGSISHQIGYRVARGVGVYDYINSILLGGLEKANVAAEEKGMAKLSPEQYAAFVLSPEAFSQYSLSKKFKENYQNKKNLPQFLRDFVSDSSYDESAEFASLKKQVAEEFINPTTRMFEDTRAYINKAGDIVFGLDVVSNILGKQLSDKSGEFDLTGELKTLENEPEWTNRILRGMGVYRVEDVDKKMESLPQFYGAIFPKVSNDRKNEIEQRKKELEEEKKKLDDLVEQNGSYSSEDLEKITDEYIRIVDETKKLNDELKTLTSVESSRKNLLSQIKDYLDEQNNIYNQTVQTIEDNYKEVGNVSGTESHPEDFNTPEEKRDYFLKTAQENLLKRTGGLTSQMSDEELLSRLTSSDEIVLNKELSNLLRKYNESQGKVGTVSDYSAEQVETVRNMMEVAKVGYEYQQKQLGEIKKAQEDAEKLQKENEEKVNKIKERAVNSKKAYETASVEITETEDFLKPDFVEDEEKTKRSASAKRGWETRRKKQGNLLAPAPANVTTSPVQTAQSGPIHVIIDGTVQGDFKNKKTVMETWDADGNLISFSTKDIGKRSGSPRGTPQLDVIKQIKEDTGNIVQMMASGATAQNIQSPRMMSPGPGRAYRVKKTDDTEKQRLKNEREYQALLNKRLSILDSLLSAQKKAGITQGREKQSQLDIVEEEQKRLDDVEQRIGVASGKDMDPERKKDIEYLNSLAESTRKVKVAAKDRGNRTIFDVIKSDIQRATMRITDFGLAAKVLNTARKEIQQVYQNILKLDEAMTNLRIVTGSNAEQAKSMMNTYNDLAMQLGTTTQAVAQSAAEWLRQGYSVSEANELIKSSTYLSRLGFMDMSQSVTALTSVMKGFRIEAADSMDIVDKLTQLDAKYATTAGDIATALSRTSAVAREAGLDLDQTAAALTTMIDVSQQDASSVGNAFRTILARYGNVKATAFTSLIGDSDDVDETNSSINDTEKVLGAIGIKIRSSAGDMRDFYDVMEELAEVYPTLDEVSRNAVATALGGTRQRNLLSIMIQNWSQVKESQEEAEKAQGTAARKMQAYNESVAYSINQLSAAWEGFAQKLEASGAVKTFFTGLTVLIKNLGTALSMVLSTVVSLRSFKLTTDLKRLADFFGFESSEGKGRLKTKWDKTKDWFSPNRMTRQAEQEKEKYEQQKADTSEKRSRNEVVNSNNKVVDALNRNADALDRNSNAQNAKQAAQSAKPDIGSNYSMGARGVEQGTLNGRRVYKAANGQWKYYNNRPVTSGAENIKTTTAASQEILENEPQSKEMDISRRWLLGLTGSTISGAGYFAAKKARKNIPLLEQQIKDLEATGNFDESTQNGLENTWELQELKDQLEKDQNTLKSRDVRVQELKANWKQGAIRGVGTGLTAGIISGMSAEGDVQDKLVTGATTAITTGLLSAIPGVGTILGPILGPILGGFFGKEINKLLKADETARKQRVEDAKKQLEAINGIGSSVTGLIDLNKKDQALWDSDDWKQFNEQVETINEALEKSELGDKIINLGDRTKTLSEYFEEAARTGNKEMLARVEAEKIRFEAEKTYTAGEQDRYTLQKEINENQKKLANLDDDEISKKKELTAAIKAAKAEIEDYSKALKKGYMQASFYSSGVGTMESYDIGNATLDRVIMQIARDWAEKSPDIFAGNQLTSDARSDIISYLREQSGYSSLFKNDTKNVRDMLNAEKAVENLKTTLGMSQKQLKEFANSKDLSEIADKFGATGDALYKIIDQVNLVDEDGISTIAHAMNMTVEQFREANSEGAFDWLTTDVAIGGLDKLNEKLATFNELLLAASENSLFSQENINKIVGQYPTLLKKIDEETGKISVSMDNVQENLVDILAGGESLRKVYAGFFSRDIATSAEKWDVFISSIRENIEKDSALDGFRDEIFKQTNYSGFLKVYEEHKDELESYNQSFIEYAKSLFSTDIFDTQQEILTKYATSTLETEISNLESIRDSLDEVNKQREKEIELIKAKEALENASKEKKRVYRAGVGFVYTTDQEAVKSAQEKVDELERQRDKDDIQYQIDSLQQQKEILENIKDNEQLKALQETAKETLEALGVNGALVTAILSGSKEEFNAAIKAGLDKDIGDKAADVNNEIASKKKEAYYRAKAELDAFQQGKKFTGKFEQTMDANGNKIDDYSKPIFESMSKKDLEQYGGVTPAQLKKYQNSPFYSVGAGEEEKLVGAVESAGKEWKNEDENAQIQNIVKTFKKQDYKTNFLITNPEDNYKGNKESDLGLFSVSKEEIIDITDRIEGDIKKFRYALQDTDGTIGKWQSFSFDVAKDGTIEKQISDLKGPAVIANLDDRPNTVFYKGADNKYYKMYGYNDRLNTIKEGKAPGNDSELWTFTILNGEPFLNTSDVKNWENYDSKIKELLYGSTNETAYASGTLSAPGGRSLINENGLESIITPSGTITSLPAKSGIIPADLTRNLWALGEVAPNLIARLGGNSLQTNNSNSSTDNSINIQNLDATFNTQSDFDGRRFLTDLRNQVILTANNH